MEKILQATKTRDEEEEEEIEIDLDNERLQWREAGAILRSRHFQIWQARTIYMIAISAFVALVSTKNILKLPASSFLLIFTLFMLVLDAKYQTLKRTLYTRLDKLEKDLDFDIYRAIHKKDNPYYPFALYGLLISGILMWFYLA